MKETGAMFGKDEKSGGWIIFVIRPEHVSVSDAIQRKAQFLIQNPLAAIRFEILFLEKWCPCI
jgi:hypothetical protein